MSKFTKYRGIDQREIDCCDPSETTIEAGISFDVLENGQNVLRFHFLEYLDPKNKKLLNQTTKSMWLDKDNTKQLISALQGLSFTCP